VGASDHRLVEFVFYVDKSVTDLAVDESVLRGFVRASCLFSRAVCAVLLILSVLTVLIVLIDLIVLTVLGILTVLSILKVVLVSLMVVNMIFRV